MILNPADPPVLMRNTVYCLVDGDADRRAIESDVAAMADSGYVPGYRPQTTRPVRDVQCRTASVHPGNRKVHRGMVGGQDDTLVDIALDLTAS